MKLTHDLLKDLSDKIEGIIELETGTQPLFVCVLADCEGHIGLFSGCHNPPQLISLLEASLDAVKTDHGIAPIPQ